MIDVKSLHKTFSLSKKRLKEEKHKVAKDSREIGNFFHTLQDISFEFSQGEIIGLLGSNGAGKTTLLRILSTTLKPTSGRVLVNGIDVCENPIEVRRQIGFLSGNSGLYGRLTPREIMAFFGKFYGIKGASLKRRVDELFGELDINSYADRKCDCLSSGMKQKVSIARSLLHSPEIIIFDEPTTGLDVGASQAVLNYIERLRSDGRTIIFSTHHMHEVSRLCDRVLVMSLGQKRFEGTVSEMLNRNNTANLNDAYLDVVNLKASA